MRISIIVPTCPAHREDTLSPKSGLSFRYPMHHDDETFSTRSSPNSSYSCEEEYSGHASRNDYDVSGRSREEYRKDELSHEIDDYKTSAKENSNQPLCPTTQLRQEPLSSSDIYNTLVVGQPSQRHDMDSLGEVNKVSYHNPHILPMNPINPNPSASIGIHPSGSYANPILPEQLISSQEDVYQRLVVGTGPMIIPIHQMSSLHSTSFQSLESSFSRQVIYQAESSSTNKLWDPPASLPADTIEEEEVEEEEKEHNATPKNDILAMIENGEMYTTWVVAPFMMAAGTRALQNKELTKNQPFIPSTSTRGPLDDSSLIKRKYETPNSIKKISCAAEAIENDFLSMIETLRSNMTCNGREQNQKMNSNHVHEEETEDDDELPMTRLSADLRKQRLRNQVLSYERDTMNQENHKLREQLKEQETKIKDLELQVQELQVVTKKAEDEAIQRNIKIAQMINDSLESRM